MDYVDELEAAARRRHVRWDPALWRQVLEGPARQLAAGLAAARAPAEHAEALARAYLRLASEAIGLGYLSPSSAGAATFFTLTWMDRLPRTLPALPVPEQARALAAAWNLGENLEASPGWLRRIFLRLGARDEHAADLEGLVATVARRALDPPERRLGARPRVVWLSLADEDRRFLPGVAHFVSPTVVCVHPRELTRPAPAPAATAERGKRKRKTADALADAPPAETAAPFATASGAIGVWLDDEPLVLGPMGCTDTPAAAPPDPGTLALVEELARQDARAADVREAIVNEWRALVTLETSQFVVALLPAAAGRP